MSCPDPLAQGAPRPRHRKFNPIRCAPPDLGPGPGRQPARRWPRCPELDEFRYVPAPTQRELFEEGGADR